MNVLMADDAASGQFSPINLPNVAGVTFDVQYNATDVTVTVS
jgi:hypothetical protein